MSDEKRYTERELVLAVQKAYAYALCPGGIHGGTPCAACEAQAKRFYPLPHVTRPRVVKDDFGISWKVADNEFQWQGAEGEWISSKLYGNMRLSAERVALWADLLANPTETVEDGE